MEVILNIVDVLTHLSKDEINNARAEVLQTLKGCKSKKEFKNIAHVRKDELQKVCDKYNLGTLKIEIIGDMGFVSIDGAPLTAFGLEAE